MKTLCSIWFATMEIPIVFSWFHLMWLAITFGLCLLIALTCKKENIKRDKFVLYAFSIVSILLEVYKQIVFTKQAGGNYQWYAFPFQFCSTPIYVALLSALFHKSKFSQALNTFLATFGLLAGLLVMFYPGDVFTELIGINIQTMYVHCGMVVLGFYLIRTKNVLLSFKGFLSGFLVFVVLALIALGLDIALVKTGVVAGHTFNMFFISPYFDCTLPVYNIIYQKVPYWVFLLSYFVGFFIGSYVVFCLNYLRNLFGKKKQS